MNKSQRALVLGKSNGYCWYCGLKLSEKGWHVDHVEPVYSGGKDGIDNLVPACAPCNLLKSVFTVEEFRYELEQQPKRARDYSVNFRMAERFGLVGVRRHKVVFWFEERKP